MAWTQTTVARKFVQFETTTAVAMAGTAVDGDTLAASDIILGDMSIYVGINMTVAGNDVTSNLVLQHSPDNSTWTTDSTPIADTTPNVTGYKMAFVNLSGKHAPYWRLRWNDNAQAAGTTGRIKFVVIALKPGAIIHWEGSQGL